MDNMHLVLVLQLSMFDPVCKVQKVIDVSSLYSFYGVNKVCGQEERSISRLVFADTIIVKDVFIEMNSHADFPIPSLREHHWNTNTTPKTERG